MAKKYAIQIENDKRSEMTREPVFDDQRDRGDYHDYHNIKGFTVHGPNDYYDLVVPYEPEWSVIYYLLYVVYSTGDSFGHTRDGGIEYIGLYTREQMEMAVRNQKLIEQPPSERKKRELELYSPEGKRFKCYAPWEGYFERLSYTEIKGVHRLS